MNAFLRPVYPVHAQMFKREIDSSSCNEGVVCFLGLAKPAVTATLNPRGSRYAILEERGLKHACVYT